MIKQLFERRSSAGSLRRTRRGQSLVEFALSLPVMLLILAATLEVGNVLTQYNRVQAAAREGARFGAAGGIDAGVSQVVQQAATESLDVDEDQMDIWVIRPIIDASTSTWFWNSWSAEEEHVFGNSPDDSDPLDATSVLNDLTATSGFTNAEDIHGERFVVVVVRYKADTILNLPFFNIPGETGGQVPIWAYTVLRQEIEQEAVAQGSSGCSAYPIAFNQDELDGLGEDDTFNLTWTNSSASSGQFTFLSWNSGKILPADLAPSMTFPGNSLKPSADGGYEQYNVLPSDYQMQRTDKVLSNPGDIDDANSGGALDGANGHETTDRAIRVVLYNTVPEAAPGLGGIWQYTISNFAIVRIDSFDSTSITFKFVRWDYSCGL